MAQELLHDTLPTAENPPPVSPNGSQQQVDVEKASAARQGRWKNSLQYLRTDISLEYADVPIIACCFVSGLCDSSAYNAWTCFVSMQTGNTIFLALGASGQPVTHPYGWLKSLMSIITFLLGCIFFASTRHIDPHRRATLSGSFFIQGLCIFIAAALVQAGVAPQPIGTMVEDGSVVRFIELLPLGFLAFQSGGQIVTSRLLGFNEVPTTVLTSVYCDLVSDAKMFTRKNVKRNRRAAAVITLLLGGICGGWLSRSNAGMSAALWLAGAVKMVIAISWSFWKGKSVLNG